MLVVNHKIISCLLYCTPQKYKNKNALESRAHSSENCAEISTQPPALLSTLVPSRFLSVINSSLNQRFKMAKYVLLFLLVSPMLVQGWDFFGLFKKSDPTTTPSPIISSTSVPSTTQRATTTTESNGACWWTQCGTRCTATATVHDFTSVNCNPGQYKFRCCSS